MSKCIECGILEQQDSAEKWFCVKHNRVIDQENLSVTTECLFFIEKRSEDGEILSPNIHIALIEAERGTKKMKGPLG